MPSLQLTFALPPWVDDHADWQRRYPTADDRMALVIGLGQEQVRRGDGGPFSAAVFERDTGALVSVGVNLAVPAHNPVLHAEVVAVMLACARLHSHTLGAAGLPAHELVCSCEPCAMCLGAAAWSGVASLVTGATKADAESIGFDEGPVFPESWAYLARRGVRVQREVRRGEAREILASYLAAGGTIY